MCEQSKKKSTESSKESWILEKEWVRIWIVERNNPQTVLTAEWEQLKFIQYAREKSYFSPLSSCHCQTYA